MNSIHHFYHIYADGDWTIPVQEHADALRKSKLQDYPGFSFHVGIVGNEENANRVRDYLDRNKTVWALAGWQHEGWEQLTLSALAADCQHADGLAFYGHTKGAHAPSRFNTEWRQRMTHFNVTRWKDAVTALQTHDAYGCHWMELEGNWIFGGNFWWTHMRHLRFLEPPKLEDRWRAEEWVGHLRHHVGNFRVHDPAPPFPGKVNPPHR